MDTRKAENPLSGDGTSPGKIFVGGLAKDATLDQFSKYFEKYGEITDSVIMKDRQTGRPRGFGFITYADPAVVDRVIDETHVINGKQVEIKRTTPKGAGQANDLKTKKIFVGGIPTSVTEDEFKNFFSKYGKVMDHEIICDHATKRSRGFGFIVFDSEKVVDNILAEGNMIDMVGTKVEIKKAEPKKPSNPAPSSGYGSELREPRVRPYSDGFGSFGDSFSGFAGRGFGPGRFRSHGGIGGRFSDYGGYGGADSDFSGGYDGFGSGGFGGYQGESSFGYSSRFGSYDRGLGGGYGAGGGGYGANGLGAYGRGGAGYRGAPGYDSGAGAGYGGAGGLYGSAPGYGAGRYHPYAR